MYEDDKEVVDLPPRHDVSWIIVAAALGFMAGLLLAPGTDAVRSLEKDNKDIYRLYSADHRALDSCSRYEGLIRALEVSRLKLSPADQIKASKELPWREGGER